MNFSQEEVIFDVPDDLRPRAMRRMGMKPQWDVIVDALPKAKRLSLSGMLAGLCRLYRALRPESVGNRCAFEPSCSRYAELCFRVHGPRRALGLIARRLHRCTGDAGGIDLPPGIDHDCSIIHGGHGCNIA